MNPNSVEQKNIALEKIASKVEAYFCAIFEDDFFFNKKSFSARIAQKIALETGNEFYRGFKEFKNILKEEGNLHFQENDLCIASNGNITMGFKGKLKCFTKFSILWAAFLFFGVFGFLGSSIGRKKVHFLYGIPLEMLGSEEKNQKFFEYCNSKYKEYFGEHQQIYIQHVGKQGYTFPGETIKCARNPLMAALSESSLSLGERFTFAKNHLIFLFKFLRLCYQYPAVFLLWQDFSMYAAGKLLNDAGILKKIVLTNSNWKQQFLWMFDVENRSFTVDMAPYSLNTFLFSNIDDPVVQMYAPMPRANLDRILCWNEDQARLLGEAGVTTQKEVVEPVLWRNVDEELKTPNPDAYTITVFDVHPRTKKWETMTGTEGEFYSLNSMKEFIAGIKEFVEKVEKSSSSLVQVSLKHKRASHWSYEKEYDDFVFEWLDNKPNVNLASVDENLFSIVSSSDLVVVAPYSSPAHVASYLGVPAIYYDPSKKLASVYPAHDLIYHACGLDELLALVDNKLFAESNERSVSSQVEKR